MPNRPDSVTHSSTSLALARAALFKFVGLLFLVFVLASYLLIYLAQDLNKTEELESAFYTNKAIQSFENSLATTLKDYAFWGDAYRNMHLHINTDWAYTKQNLGASLHQDFNIKALFLINSENHTVYAVIDGKMVKTDSNQWLKKPIFDILQNARSNVDKQEAITSFISLEGVPALIAAAALTPGTDPTVKVDKRIQSVLVFVKLLDNTLLEKLGNDYGVQKLRLVKSQTKHTVSELFLGSEGSAGTLQWTPEQPGHRLLQLGLPLIAIAALLVFIMTWVILRRATSAAKALDATHTNLKNSQTALVTSESRFRDVVEASSDWVWEINEDFQIIYLSDRFSDITGLVIKDWIGRNIDGLLISDSGKFSDSLKNQNEKLNTTIYCSCVDGSDQERITRISARNMGGIGFRGTATDVTKEVRAQQRIEYLSQHDVLTGLPNRSKLRDFLDVSLKISLGLKKPLALLTLDLDRFKPVNDLLGHSAGDIVLNEVSKRLAACIRHGDLVARVGGDEFVLVIANVESQKNIEELCERLIKTTEESINVDLQDVFVSASIGIAMAPHDAVNALELLRYADIALYEAKASGRNTWRFYAGDMNLKIIERRRLESDLRFAINNDELRLHFQPRYCIANSRLLGAEALVRWQHPERGLISPDTFIPIAEETGLIIAMSDWVLKTACEKAALWPQELFISINLSSIEFKRSPLVDRVQYAIDTTGIDPKRVELEITETVMLEDAEGALQVMQALKKIGVRIAMDDFGTGYSSLSYLRTFPFDGIKIDRSFVSRLLESDSDKSILQAIVGLGKALSLTVTAEGIETIEQMNFLNEISCEEGQGYLFSKPLEQKDFDILLDQKKTA
jgi:diguanylate cyclase (GGDEF)-like protein/PAS domain S-box-containing protein